MKGSSTSVYFAYAYFKNRWLIFRCLRLFASTSSCLICEKRLKLGTGDRPTCGFVSIDTLKTREKISQRPNDLTRDMQEWVCYENETIKSAFKSKAQLVGTD